MSPTFVSAGVQNGPRISAELFLIPLDQDFVVYAPLRQAAFLASGSLVNLIADLQRGVEIDEDELEPGWIEFLRRLEIVDGGAEPRPITTFSGTPKPTSLTLFLTTGCNLRCTYCYASAGDTPFQSMPLSVARQGIDFVIGNAVELNQPEIEIAYHGGGEPSLNWKTLTESLDYAERRAAECGLKVRASMATNGVLDDGKLDWIITRLNDGVSVSFDGLPEVHDVHRLTVQGQGSSERVMHSLRRFDAVDFPYGLRLTVTHDHLSKMEPSVRFLCENFRPRRIQLEPAYQLGRWRDAPSAETAEFIRGFRLAQQTAREFGRTIDFSAARVGSLSNHFCGITQDSFCLTADGHVSACYESFLKGAEWSEKFFYGSHDAAAGTFRFELPVLNELRSQSVENRPFCEGCFAKWTCGGDCYHKALTVNGGGEFQGSDRCHIIRELTLDQMLSKIVDSGGVFWHARPHNSAVRSDGKEILR